MITTIIAWCFVSTGWWYDNWPQVDQLWKQWYTECYNYHTDKKEILKTNELWSMYKPFDNIQWSNGIPYWSVEISNGKNQWLVCDYPSDWWVDMETGDRHFTYEIKKWNIDM